MHASNLQYCVSFSLVFDINKYVKATKKTHISPLIALTSLAILALTFSMVSPSASVAVTVNSPFIATGLMKLTSTPLSALNDTCGCPGAQSSLVFSGASASSVNLTSIVSSCKNV